MKRGKICAKIDWPISVDTELCCEEGHHIRSRRIKWKWVKVETLLSQIKRSDLHVKESACSHYSLVVSFWNGNQFSMSRKKELLLFRSRMFINSFCGKRLMTEKKETRQMGRNNQEARVQAPTEENEGTVGN